MHLRSVFLCKNLLFDIGIIFLSILLKFFSIQNSLKFLFTVTKTNNPYIFITYFKHVFVIVFLDDKLDTRRKIPSHTHTHIRHDKSCCLTFYAYLKITLSKEISWCLEDNICIPYITTTTRYIIIVTATKKISSLTLL